MQRKEGWELRIENELCSRWRERRLKFEKDENMKQDTKDVEDTCSEKDNSDILQKKIENEKLYSEYAINNHSSTLLLPSLELSTSEQELSKLSFSGLSGLDKVNILSYSH